MIKHTPVMAGLLGADPTRNMEFFLDEIIAAGFSGIMNCPTLALVDGNFRRTLEETGVKFDMEVEMIAIGHRKGLYTKAFCTTPEEAQKMMDADVITSSPMAGTRAADRSVPRPRLPSKRWWDLSRASSIR